MRDKLMRLIFECLETSQFGGMELQPSKHKQIQDLINRAAFSKERGDLAVVYEIIGYLMQNRSRMAADALTQMMMTVQSASEAEKADRAMWLGARP